LLVVKACGEEQAPTLSVRFAEPDGAPATKLTFSTDLASAEAAAATAAALAKTPFDKKKPPQNGKLGPVQSFEKLTAGANPTSHDLEAYARYLDETDGDDPALHRARDLARRAAEREPTVERLLLAGRLAEDRNQAGEWIEKAEKLVEKQGKPNREVLLARAWHRRHGPNFREAMP
jgi:hypothetical protein